MSGAQRSKTRVLLVDDHPMVRRGLAALINEEADLMVCGEAGDRRTALELTATTKPDLAIIEITLNNEDGLELIKEIRARRPRVRILVLSMHDEEIYAERALRAGASGYVRKAEAAVTVMSAIRHVLSGKIYANEAVTERLLDLATRHGDCWANCRSAVERLSDREFQIFLLLGEGVKVSVIATQLYLSTKTVETHRANIRKKLYINSSDDLLRYAIQFSRNRDPRREPPERQML